MDHQWIEIPADHVGSTVKEDYDDNLERASCC